MPRATPRPVRVDQRRITRRRNTRYPCGTCISVRVGSCCDGREPRCNRTRLKDWRRSSALFRTSLREPKSLRTSLNRGHQGNRFSLATDAWRCAQRVLEQAAGSMIQPTPGLLILFQLRWIPVGRSVYLSFAQGSRLHLPPAAVVFRSSRWCGGFDIRSSVSASPHCQCQTQNDTRNIYLLGSLWS
jgi:hypothetical protein